MGFKSKNHAFSLAKKYHLCTACLTTSPIKFEYCPICKAHGMRVYFPSRIEMLRACDLIRLQIAKRISNLRFHPRYPIIVNGEEICVYVADTTYFDCDLKKTVVEDVKASGNFMDDVAALKIALFNAINKEHGLSVSIHRRK